MAEEGGAVFLHTLESGNDERRARGSLSGRLAPTHSVPMAPVGMRDTRIDRKSNNYNSVFQNKLLNTAVAAITVGVIGLLAGSFVDKGRVSAVGGGNPGAADVKGGTTGTIALLLAGGALRIGTARQERRTGKSAMMRGRNLISIRAKKSLTGPGAGVYGGSTIMRDRLGGVASRPDTRDVRRFFVARAHDFVS